MMEDWRFAKSPYVESGGLRAYAGAPLRLQNETGQTACLGSLCVASSTPQPSLTRAHQTTLVRLADWVVSDLVQLTRARRQRARRKMVERMAAVREDSFSEEHVLRMLQETYPNALVKLQSVQSGHIEAEGRGAIPVSDLSSGLWEDVDRIERVIMASNHLDPPHDRVVRIVAAKCESVSGHLFLTVGTREFQFVFDDIDAWFVQKCAAMISEAWNKHVLEEVMFAKEKFLRGFSHQLRTPIHGILGSVELLTEELRTMSPATATSHATAWLQANSLPSSGGEHSMYLDTIKRAGRDLLSIINSMITLNRWADVATRERLYTTHTFHDLETELGTEITKLTSGDSRYNASVIFNHNFPPDRCSIRTDLALLRDSLFPLIANAIQNTQNGTVAIATSVCANTKELIVDIRDTGCGIAQEAQKRIFKLYETADVYSFGAGVGLTLSSKFAALLQGSVSLISSEVNRGSHFRATYGSIDLRFSEETLLDQPLVPQLPNLPRRFHVVETSSTSLSLGVHFSKFLSCYGWTASNTMEDTVIIIDFETQGTQCREITSQLPPNQAIICLVPYSAGDFHPIHATQNVISVHGPFLTSTMSEALNRADKILTSAKITSGDWFPRPENALVLPNLAKFAERNHHSCNDNGTAAKSTEAMEDPLAIVKSAVLNTVQNDQCNSPHIGIDTRLNLEASNGASYSTPPNMAELSVLSCSQSLNSVADIKTPKAERLLCNLLKNQNGVDFPPLEQISHPTALLVDDNDVNLRLLKMYCIKRSLHYLCARDGLEAVSVFQNQQSSAATDATKQPIQLILMDLQMPNCDGIEASRRIRELEREMHWRESVLLVITGQDSVEDSKAACEVGIQEFCVKPTTMKSLDGWLKKYFPVFGS